MLLRLLLQCVEVGQYIFYEGSLPSQLNHMSILGLSPCVTLLNDHVIIGIAWKWSQRRRSEHRGWSFKARDQKLVRKMMKEQYVGSSMSDFGRAADHDKVGHDRVLYNVHVDASVCVIQRERLRLVLSTCRMNARRLSRTP